MSASPTITYESVPLPEEIACVRAGLSTYNQQRAADDTYEALTLFIRDADGTVIGGLLGGTIWSWLYVDVLWVSDTLRGQGYGTRLLNEAEQLAFERGCIASHLDTMSFQALPFYQRHGYTIYGVLDNIPPGHQKYLLQKPLV